MYNENKRNKLFCNDLPDEIKNDYPFYYDIKRKSLYLIEYRLMRKLLKVEKLYLYDDDFYVQSKDYLLVVWLDIQAFNIISRR